MQWRNDRERELGINLGFILTAPDGRAARVVNILFGPGDVAHNSPLQGNVRPASSAECKMWRMLMAQSFRDRSDG